MNFLKNRLSTVFKTIRSVTTQGAQPPSLLSSWNTMAQFPRTSAVSLPLGSLVQRCMASLTHMHARGPHIKVRPPRQPLGGKPFAKGVILKTLIKKPRKPNSANRKCCLVRLSTGKEMIAYIPGIGHNLQEHNIVLVRVGRVQDLPGVKIKCVRGKYDLPHVIKK